MFGIYRFILALNVMLFHVLQTPAIGPLAVYSFFILSGFLMTTIMHKSYGYSIDGFKRYSTNRFLRLYPTYWFLIAIIILIIFIVGEEFALASHSKMKIPTTLGEWLANIGMMFIQFNPVEYSPRLAPPTWALTIEIFFYIAIGLGISKNKKLTWSWFTASVLYIVLRNLYTGYYLEVGYGSILSASLPFSVGSLIYHYQIPLVTLIKKSSHLEKGIILFFCLNVLLIPLLKYSPSFVAELFTWRAGVIVTWLNIPLSALMTIILFNTRTKRDTVKSIDNCLGDLSYPLYIFHTTAACLATWIFVKFGFSSKDEHILPIFVLSFVITIAVSQLSEELINKRVNKIRQKFKTVPLN